MWRLKAGLIVFLWVLLSGGLVPVHATSAESHAKMRSVSGEIALVDIKLGKLELERDASRNRRAPSVYRINQNDTRVTDPTDMKFLKLEDLRVGQHVTVEFDYIHWEEKQEPIATKIIADPVREFVFQEATGELEAIDFQAGTLIIEEKPLPSETVKGDLSYFVFQPKDIIIMKDPSMQPVQLELNPGDFVQVEFVVRDGKRHAQSITLLSAAPETTSTTTTTTTSTTVTR